jgi:hypothetical protein
MEHAGEIPAAATRQPSRAAADDTVQRVAPAGGPLAEALHQSPRGSAQRRVNAAIEHSPRAVAQRQAAGGVVQLSLRSRYEWSGYVGGLANNAVTCDAIDTGEARTTLELTHNAQGDITHRIIRLHTWADDAWGAIGSVTMDRSPMPVAGPLMPGAAPLGIGGYDDAELTLHTAAPAGGNAGVATHLFPAVLGWINRNLRGVRQVSMNPAAAGGPAVVPIGGGAGPGMALNTWDTRLNTEHLHDLASLDAGPRAGLSVNADAMSRRAAPRRRTSECAAWRYSNGAWPGRRWRATS